MQSIDHLLDTISKMDTMDTSNGHNLHNLPHDMHQEKNMGFADYFSRYPIFPAPQPLESDKNYVINLLNTFKHILKNAQRISSNQNAPKLHHAYPDATKARKGNKQSKHASCHSRYLKQSISCSQSNSSLYNLSLYNPKFSFL